MTTTTIKVFDGIRSNTDVVAEGSLVAGRSVYLKDIRLVHDGNTIAAFKLRDQKPKVLADWIASSGNSVDYSANTCEEWHHICLHEGICAHMDELFPFHNIDIDFEELELGSHSWQPKLDVLTERFDELDVVNALDAELVAEFVTQLSAGGDAFALIDSKVLVETQRAYAAEVVNTDSITAEILRADAAEQVNAGAITAEATRAGLAEVANTDSITAEATRAGLAEVANADAISAEAIRAGGVESGLLTNVNSRVLATAPVTTGQLQAQGGVQTADVVGSQSLLLRSIVDANVRIEPSGTGTVEVSKALNCAAAVSATSFSQNGSAVLDTTSSVTSLSDISGSGSGSIITTGERSDLVANTAKRTYPQSEEDQVAANTLKLTYPTSEQVKVAANTLKITFPTSEQDKVTANTLKITYPTSESDKVAINALKYTQAQVNTLLDDKAEAGSPTFTGTLSLPNNTIDNSTSGRWKIDAQVFEFGTGSAATTIESKGSQNIIFKAGAGSGTMEITPTDINLYCGSNLVKTQGKVKIGAVEYPAVDGSPSQFLQTDGSGTLSFASVSSGGRVYSSAAANNLTLPDDCVAFLYRGTGGNAERTLPDRDSINDNASAVDFRMVCQTGEDTLKIFKPANYNLYRQKNNEGPTSVASVTINEGGTIDFWWVASYGNNSGGWIYTKGAHINN